MVGSEPKVKRPVLRYHGGKWRLAPWIISHFPKHRIYVEPYGGAASVLMRKPRSYAEVYNDLDGEIVNVFRVLRDPESARELERMIRLTPFAREEFNTAYQPTDAPPEQARRTLARAWMGFGSTGATRSNRTGFRHRAWRSRTTAADDWANYPLELRVFCERLQGVVIENRDALSVIADQDSDTTLFYVDPPYQKDARTDNDDDYRHELTDADHVELSAVLHSIKGMVIISGYDCELYQKLYSDWHMAAKSALADKALKRTECLWISPNIALPQTKLFHEADFPKES